MRMKKEEYFKYFFLLLFLLIAYLSWQIARPFVGAILSALVLAYIFYPVYKWLQRHIKSKTVSSLIVSAVLILILFLPLFFFANTIVDDARVGYIILRQKLATGNVFGVACPEDDTSTICTVTAPLNALLADPQTNVYLQEAISKGTTFILTQITGFLLSLPKIMIQLAVTFFLLFYLFIEGEMMIHRGRKLIPLSSKHQAHILRKLQEVTYAVVYGSLIVAIIQGALGGFGFWLFGVGSPILWGIVMAIFALVPFVGTAVIWLPAALFLMVVGAAEGNTTMLWNGIGLLLWGALLVSTIDNFLKPKIIGDRGGVHPALVLIGALGGLALIGFIGFIIGPLILALLKTMLDIYEKEELHRK